MGITILFNGQQYRTLLDARIAEELTARRVGFEYRQHQLEWQTRDGKERHVMLLDFTLDNGTHLVCCKPRSKAERDRLMTANAIFFKERLRFIVESDDKISKQSKYRYSDWAARSGLHMAVGTELPPEWLNTPSVPLELILQRDNAASLHVH